MPLRREELLFKVAIAIPTSISLPERVRFLNLSKETAVLGKTATVVLIVVEAPSVSETETITVIE